MIEVSEWVRISDLRELEDGVLRVGPERGS
jgi:hypothetical protein